MWSFTDYLWLAVKVWAAGVVPAAMFYGLFMLFKQRLLNTDEVADRTSDGRMFRDMLLWPLMLNPFDWPLLAVVSLVYPFFFTMRRWWIKSHRARYKTPYQAR